MVKHPLVNAFPISRADAVRILDLLEGYDARVMVSYGPNLINVQSMLGLLSLSADTPKDAELVADGPDAEEAIEAVAGLLNKPGA